MSTFFPGPETPDGRHVIVLDGGNVEHVFYARRPLPSDLGAARITLVAAAQAAGIADAAADISVERHDDGLCLTLFRALPDGTTVGKAAHAPDAVAWRRLCDERIHTL